jgi:hypothetical protein
MPAELRIPYYSLGLTRFYVKRSWLRFAKAQGCKPLDNPQAAILMDRKPPLLPGENSLLAKQAAAKRKADAEEAKRSKAAQKVESQPRHSQAVKIEKASLKASNDQAKSEQPVKECKPPPPFDMLDLPDAMHKMGFPVAAKLSRRWFNGRKHVLGSKRDDLYPPDMVDSETVTLDFVLQYENVKEKYDRLIKSEIYTSVAVREMNERIRKLLAKRFIETDVTFSGQLDTIARCRGDFQQLDREFRFQDVEVFNFDTVHGRFLTDLTASLANFTLRAAIANARVQTEKYYKYPKGGPAVYCCQSHVEVTHIYVYARDSYSYADITGRKASQYLGHWNRNGVILILEALVADRANRYGIDIEWGNTPSEPMLSGFDRPVDTLKGWFGEMRKQDVYYPVHNRDYSTWREKFNRGGDFLIFTKPRKIKLPDPIKFSTEDICRPASQPAGR